MKPLIKREKGQWVYYVPNLAGLLHSKQLRNKRMARTPVVRAAEWSDFKVLVANWRKNHGY